MSIIAIKDARITLAQYDIASDINRVKISDGQDVKEDTTFGSTFRTYKAGVRKAKFEAGGLLQFGSGVTTIEGRLRSKFAVADMPISVAADGGDAGELSYFLKSVMGKYDYELQHGELARFAINADASGQDVQLVRGTIFEDGKTARTAAGNSAVFTLGPIAANQKLYAVLHLLAFSGTNVTFSVRSAVTDFATITTHASFTTFSAVNSQFVVTNTGEVTNTFWRVDWAGTFTSFNALVSVGIQ